jgi:DNA mismatch repair protein MutS
MLESGAALPSGKYASMRGRKESRDPQLDLFVPAQKAEQGTDLVAETLRALDIDRLTPIEALTLLARLKASIEGKP